MTPTEQDKELRTQIRNTLYNHEIGFSLANANGRTPEQMVEELIDAMLYLATADRKRVALEARIDELKMWELPENEIQMVFADPCNICGHDYPKLRKAQQDRLSALKAQQEEVSE